MDSYKKSYVAFLDILGFKEMINTSAFDKIFNIFQLNICSDEYKKAFSKAFNENDDNCEDLKAYNEALQNAMIYTMSDSIVISTDSEKPMALEVIIDACLYVQTMLYTFDTPILLRGAIAVGDYYCNNSIAFGKGMVDAYICQENYSIYPRIILSTDIVKKLSDSSYKEDKLCLDDDGYYHIDCVKEYLDGKSESSEGRCRIFWITSCQPITRFRLQIMSLNLKIILITAAVRESIWISGWNILQTGKSV